MLKSIIFIILILLYTNKSISCENIEKNFFYINLNLLKNNKYKEVLEKMQNIDQNCLYYKDLNKFIIQYIFVNYKLKNFKEADEYTDKILNFNKYYKHIDYVLYMKGLINLQLDKLNLKNNFIIDLSNKNIENINIAYINFNKLINNFPKSIYYNDSKEKIKYINYRLAINDLSIIDFYYKKKMYLSVINRSIEVLKKFPEEPFIYYAIFYIKKSTNLLSIKKIERNIDLIIKKNKTNFNKFNFKIN